ncbi:DUF3244 domain-containing protein [Lunatibacter salilacus]|uniref:DUF3244 domain-containing protein n=1 Tax=Lunatibacter salilacus TaxID=2483804 RepID=UPI00131C6300|nr:DUF3244 domain-containing protein [Lunatibacter salilacus]
MRLIIATIVALSVSFGSYVYAGTENGDPIVTLEKLGDSKFQLKYMTQPVGKVIVSIKNEQNAVVYKDVIDTEKLFYRNYDLTNLAVGNYHLEVSEPNGNTFKAFDVDLTPTQRKSTYVADTKVLDNKTIALLVRNLDQTEKTVRIYEGYELIHEEKFDEETFGKRFTFKNVNSLKNVSFEIIESDGFGKYISAK